MTQDFATRDRLPLPPIMILMVGLPRSGKSTAANGLHQRLGYTIVARDDIRRALSIDGFDPNYENQVSDIEHHMLRALLGRGQSVIVDNTNHTLAVRKFYLDLAQEFGIRVKVLKIDFPERDEWQRRCRESNFSWEVVERMLAEYEELSEHETLMI